MNQTFFKKSSILLYGISLLLLASNFLFADELLNAQETAQERKFTCKPASSCNGPTCITSLPYCIKEPGTYCLTKSFDLTFIDDKCTPNTDPCVVGITVLADDVVLNLNGFTITGAQHGIVIQECSVNVQIKHGIIKDSLAEAIVVGKDSRSVSLMGINVINSNSGTTCNGTAAVLFDGTLNDQIKNSALVNVNVSYSAGTGISLKYCQDCEVLGCTVLSQHNGTSTDANGFYVSGSGNFFRECIANGISSLNDGLNAHGFFAENSTDTYFQNCLASSVISSGAATAVEAAGFTVANSQNVILDVCSSSSMIGTNAYAFESRSSVATLIKECQADSYGTAYFLSGDNKSIVIRSNAIKGINGYNLLNCSNCVVGLNKALSNTTGYTETPTVNSTNNFYYNYASGNTTNYLVSPNIVTVGLHCPPILGGNINGNVVCP